MTRVSDTRTWCTGCARCGSTWDTHTWPHCWTRWCWSSRCYPRSTRTRPPTLSRILSKFAAELEREYCCVTVDQRLKTLQLSYSVSDKKSAMVQPRRPTWAALARLDCKLFAWNNKAGEQNEFHENCNQHPTSTNIMTSSSYFYGSRERAELLFVMKFTRPALYCQALKSNQREANEF